MNHHKHERHIVWQDMRQGQRVTAFLAIVIQVSLLVAALQDIRRRSAAELRGRKAMWTAISFINFIGPISYFVFGRKPQAPGGR